MVPTYMGRGRPLKYPIGIVPTYPNTPTRPTESSKHNEKDHIPEELESDPPLSDSSLSEFDSSDDRKNRKYKTREEIKIKIIGNTQNMTCQTHCRATLIRPTKGTTKRKRRNTKKSYRKKGPIKLCAKLTAIFLTKSYKFEDHQIRIG